MDKNHQNKKTPTQSHQTVINHLKEAGYNADKGIQLFINQLLNYYSVSINYMSTGVRIPAQYINEEELVDDESITVCRTYECVL